MSCRNINTNFSVCVTGNILEHQKPNCNFNYIFKSDVISDDFTDVICKGWTNQQPGHSGQEGFCFENKHYFFLTKWKLFVLYVAMFKRNILSPSCDAAWCCSYRTRCPRSPPAALQRKCDLSVWSVEWFLLSRLIQVPRGQMIFQHTHTHTRTKDYGASLL